MSPHVLSLAEVHHKLVRADELFLADELGPDRVCSVSEGASEPLRLT